MGFIYKITNDINNFIYIGQTKNSLEKRFSIHLIDSYREDKYKTSKLYNAMRKYGRNHFNIEMIEEIEDNLLDDREKYWIAFYDSKDNGYNMTYSGQGNPTRKPYLIHTIDDMNSLKEDYYNNISTKELAEKYNVSGATIWRRLKEIGIEPNVGLKKKFIMYNDKESHEFYDTTSCAKYIESLGLTDTVRKTIIASIRRVLKKERNTYLGFKFKYMEEE